MLFCSDPGVNKKDGVCKELVGEGGACHTNLEVTCLPGLACMPASDNSPVGSCTLPYSIAVGEAVSDGQFCVTGYRDRNDLCSDKRFGATSQTGGPCDTSADCESTNDLCACQGDQQGKCMSLGEAYSRENAAFACLIDSGCSPLSAVGIPDSCATNTCGSDFDSALCRESDLFMRQLNKGESLSGSNGEAFETISEAIYGCHGLGVGAMAGIIAGGVAGLALLIFLGVFICKKCKSAGGGVGDEYQPIAGGEDAAASAPSRAEAAEAGALAGAGAVSAPPASDAAAAPAGGDAPSG